MTENQKHVLAFMNSVPVDAWETMKQLTKISLTVGSDEANSLLKEIANAEHLPIGEMLCYIVSSKDFAQMRLKK